MCTLGKCPFFRASPKEGLSYLKEYFRWKEKSSMTLSHPPHKGMDNFSLFNSFQF